MDGSRGGMRRSAGRSVGVGVQLPEAEREVRWPEYRAMARAAEAVGFDAIWIGDHLLYRDPDGTTRGPHEAWTTLAGLAEATERVAIGPLVAATAFHRPPVLAKLAATVDEISGGRLVLGLGAGWNETEFRAFGLPFDRRVARFTEAFEQIRRLLAGGRVTFDGQFGGVEEAVLLPAPARTPPLMVGGAGARLLAATLPHVDWWNTWFEPFGNRADGFAAINGEIDEACERAGRDPGEVQRSACLLVSVDGGGGERAVHPEAPPVASVQLRSELEGLAQAGADEAILVLDPITESSIRSLRTALPSG
jgi:alkanesulfonate monooxygenase SsuD/methylene tetrahydromethanopterin reductase-like flavin-dependent oxidoreductase (luciferase family)